MKFSIPVIIAFFAMALLLHSCRTSDDAVAPVTNELDGLKKIKEFSNSTHTLELYSVSGTTQLGYNDLKIRIKNTATGQYEKNATLSWNPLMHMMSMSHSCPKSAITKDQPDGTLYSGYLVFQMAQNNSEYWDLQINYTINGTSFSATTAIDVPESAKRRVISFLGSDNVRYVMAYVEPQSPAVAVNDLKVGVWKTEDMNTFSVVDGFTVKIDPRMPGMGNHSSPNNVDAKQAAPGKLYTGKLSLTMTGYWKINLQLLNASGSLLKGEPVTTDNPASSIFFELEF